jgi:hypothetical protein
MPNLAAKIAAAADTVEDLQKLGDNGEYLYLRAREVYKALRHELFIRGVVIVPQTVEVSRYSPFEAVTGDITQEVGLVVTYDVTDGVEHLRAVGVGDGQDYAGKAIYKAQTGALKYLLQTLGLITGFEDDPETTNEGRVPDDLALKLDAAEKEFGSDLTLHPISRGDVMAWNKVCKMKGWLPKNQKAFLKTLGYENPSDVKRKDKAAIFAWAQQGPEEPHVEAGT